MVILMRGTEGEPNMTYADASTSSSIAWLPRIFTLVSLPSSEPKRNTGAIADSWMVRNGQAWLKVQAGYREDGSLIGVPYGILPIRILAKIAELVQAGCGREIDLGRTYREALNILGLAKGVSGGMHGTVTRMATQLERIANCTFIWSWDAVGFGRMCRRRDSDHSEEIAFTEDMGWTFEKRDGRFRLTLSEDMLRHMREGCVLLRQDHLDALGRDVLAVQCYAWLADCAYRGREFEVYFGVLRQQFGCTAKKGTRFTQKLKAALEKVKRVWPRFNFYVISGIDATIPDDDGKRGARLAGHVAVRRCEPPVAMSKSAVRKAANYDRRRDDLEETRIRKQHEFWLDQQRAADPDGLTLAERSEVRKREREAAEAERARKEAEAAERHRLWQIRDDEDRRLGRGDYAPEMQDIPF